MWVIDLHGEQEKNNSLILVLIIHLFDNIWYIYLTAKAFVTLQLDKPCSLDCAVQMIAHLKLGVTDWLCSLEEKWEKSVEPRMNDVAWFMDAHVIVCCSLSIKVWGHSLNPLKSLSPVWDHKPALQLVC